MDPSPPSLTAPRQAFDLELFPKDPEQILAFRQLARRNFRHFIRYWNLATRARFQLNWHFDYLADILQSVADRDPTTRFCIINIPPRFSKSTVTGMLWQAWMIGRDDSYSSSVFSIASSATLAARDSAKTRDILKEPWYQALFPHVRLKTTAEDEWATHRGAYRISAGVGGTVTGRGGPHIIVDDALQAADAHSTLLREKTNEWLGSTLRSRLDDPKTGSITVIQQRLHEMDNTGFLLENAKAKGADQYFHVCLPLEFSKRTVYTFRGTHYATKEPGELLHPERIGPEEVAAYRQSMGVDFETQYNQNPTNAAGGFFEESTFHWYDPSELPENLNHFMAADYATSKKTTADRSAILCVGVDEKRDLWVREESVLDWLEPLDAVTKTVQLAKRRKAYLLSHEKGVIANTLAPLFRIVCEKEGHYLSVEHYTRSDGKGATASAVKGYAQAGKVHLPRTRRAQWLPILLKFRPDVDGGDDDLVDALATAGLLVMKAGTIPTPSPELPVHLPETLIAQRSRWAHEDYDRARNEDRDD